MAEESEAPSNVPLRMKKYLKEGPFFCKIVEVIFCVFSVGLIISPFNNIPQQDLNHVAIVYVSLCGYILINGILIFCYLLGDRIPKKTSLAFSGMGAVLCLTAGLVLIRDWTNFPNNLISRYLDQYSDQMVSSGIFAVLAACVFALDTYFINKYE